MTYKVSDEAKNKSVACAAPSGFYKGLLGDASQEVLKFLFSKKIRGIYEVKATKKDSTKSDK